MKHRTSELSGALLDAAVAMAEELPRVHHGKGFYSEVWIVHQTAVRYSSEWAHGGPIIEREHIGISHEPWSDGVRREWLAFFEYEVRKFWEGPTPLIAAMRAYVSSVFGDEVEFP